MLELSNNKSRTGITWRRSFQNKTAHWQLVEQNCFEFSPVEEGPKNELHLQVGNNCILQELECVLNGTAKNIAELDNFQTNYVRCDGKNAHALN